MIASIVVIIILLIIFLPMAIRIVKEYQRLVVVERRFLCEASP